MGHQEIEHWPFRVYQDDFDNLYVHDMEEGLTFVRGNVGQNRYDLAVIIEEENAEYYKYTSLWSPNQPCGFQLLDEIDLKEWNRLAKSYLRNKRRGERSFRNWIKQQLYSPLDKILYEQSWFGESMPHPNASEEEWRDFDRAYKVFLEKQLVSL